MSNSIIAKGELSLVDRVTRVVVGIGAVIALLHMTIVSMIAYPYLTIIMSVVALTGIIGWDPLYALFRSVAAQVSGLKVNTSKSLASSL